MNFLCSVERDEETSNCWRYIDSWIFLISREKMLGAETDTDMLTKQMYVLTKYLDTVVKSAPFTFSALIILFRHWTEQKQVDRRVMFKNYTDSLGSFSKMVICMNNFMLYSTWIDCIPSRPESYRICTWQIISPIVLDVPFLSSKCHRIWAFRFASVIL